MTLSFLSPPIVYTNSIYHAQHVQCFWAINKSFNLSLWFLWLSLARSFALSMNNKQCWRCGVRILFAWSCHLFTFHWFVCTSSLILCPLPYQSIYRSISADAFVHCFAYIQISMLRNDKWVTLAQIIRSNEKNELIVSRYLPMSFFGGFQQNWQSDIVFDRFQFSITKWCYTHSHYHLFFFWRWMKRKKELSTHANDGARNNNHFACVARYMTIVIHFRVTFQSNRRDAETKRKW